MTGQTDLEFSVAGLDCPDCARQLEEALGKQPGVARAEVHLATGRVRIAGQGEQVDRAGLVRALQAQGYQVLESEEEHGPGGAGEREEWGRALGRRALSVLGVMFGVVLFVVVLGEWAGLFAVVTPRVPWLVWLPLVVAFGWPVFRNVARAARQGRVIAHTLMTVGVLAALIVGEWPTAVVVTFFMRVGEYTEGLTLSRTRGALASLWRLAPQAAVVERQGQELTVNVSEVEPGETVVVRPGGRIPVDGQVKEGQASVNQAVITGESMPVETEPGSEVYAGTYVAMGSLRLAARRVGEDTTFGRILRLVEQAESQKGRVQQLADRFAGYYLPVVLGIALLTWLVRGDTLAAVAVLVVACSCAFALATPIAMLASIGSGARQGLLVKGGRYLEALERADVMLLDKTGTLTRGHPRLSGIKALGSVEEGEILALAAAAERESEHPLARAVVQAARERGVTLPEITEFKAWPGQGVQARVNGKWVEVGSPRFIDFAGLDVNLPPESTPLYVAVDGRPAGVLLAQDTLRPEVPAALERLRGMKSLHLELLSGDREEVASALARDLGVAFRAELLPGQKLDVVKEYQERGHTVVMVGDGVNDAPALTQADVGMALGAAGADVALESAHIALLRNDWLLVPRAVQLARRTMAVVRGNIAFTVAFNAAGLTLAALGYLPPILAAAIQALPDLGILGNSSRLLKWQPQEEHIAGTGTSSQEV